MSKQFQLGKWEFRMRFFIVFFATMAASSVHAQSVHFECAWDHESSCNLVIDSKIMVASVDGGIREFDVIKLSKEAVWLAAREAYNPSKLTLHMIQRNTSTPRKS